MNDSLYDEEDNTTDDGDFEHGIRNHVEDEEEDEHGDVRSSALLQRYDSDDSLKMGNNTHLDNAHFTHSSAVVNSTMDNGRLN